MDYKWDKKQAELILAMNKHQNKFVNVSKSNYTQLNFPYDNKHITNINIGNIKDLPSNGTAISEKQTRESCIINAASIYNKSANVSQTGKYINDLTYTFENGSAGLYSEMKAPVAANPVETPNPSNPANPYPMKITLSGLLLPSDGGSGGQIVLDPNYPPNGKTIGIWIGIQSNMCAKQNAFLYYENGAKIDTINSKTPLLILKNTYLPIVIKYTANYENEIRLFPESDGVKMPFILNASNKPINYSLYTQKDANVNNPVYYNFKSDGSKMGTCTIYDTKNQSNDVRNKIENPENYGKYTVEMILQIPLEKTVEFVGLNETGTFTQYYKDSTGKYVSVPVKNNGVSIEAKNRGRDGKNKKVKYSMFFDDSIKPKSNSKTSLTFPLPKIDRTKLASNNEWEKVSTHYLESINNDGNSDEIMGMIAPHMRISPEKPMFSKDYKLKMSIEKEGDSYYLKVHKTTKNENSLNVVIPDYKMGNLFIADENKGVNTMHLVDNANKTKSRIVNGKETRTTNDYPNYYPPSNYAAKGSNYRVFDRKYNGQCAKAAQNMSHFYVIQNEKNKTQCVIPKTVTDPEFLPKQLDSKIKSSILRVPNEYITSGNVKSDAALSLNKYQYVENAYSTKSYADFKLGEKWTQNLSLPQQNQSFGGTVNYVKDALGIIPSGTLSETTNVMRERFATLQERTITQIDNSILPNFNSYLAKQDKVNQNVSDISSKLTSIDTKYDVMKDTAQYTNGVKNNQFYDFTGDVLYSLKEDRSLVPALLKDQQTMVVEHNNLFVISTITVATLLISAIFVSSE